MLTIAGFDIVRCPVLCKPALTDPAWVPFASIKPQPATRRRHYVSMASSVEHRHDRLFVARYGDPYVEVRRRSSLQALTLFRIPLVGQLPAGLTVGRSPRVDREERVYVSDFQTNVVVGVDVPHLGRCDEGYRRNAPTVKDVAAGPTGLSIDPYTGNLIVSCTVDAVIQEYSPDLALLVRHHKLGDAGIVPWLAVRLLREDADCYLVVDIRSPPLQLVRIVSRVDGAVMGTYCGIVPDYPDTSRPPPPLGDFQFSPIGVAMRSEEPTKFYVLDHYNGRLESVDIQSMACDGCVDVVERDSRGVMALGVHADNAADRLLVATTSGVVVFDRHNLIPSARRRCPGV